MWSESALALRPWLLEFLIESAQLLEVSPIVKYTALSFFADRFYPRFSRLKEEGGIANWLLQPLRESNLQLFALVSIWISSKIHSSRPLSIKSFKSLGDKVIKEQHFTNRDFLEAEVVLMQVLNFEIGAVDIAFIFLEELLHQLREVAKVGDLVNFEACMDIMDLLYEKGEISTEHCSSRSLAASTLVASYVITVPKQRWEFPILPWGKFQRIHTYPEFSFTYFSYEIPEEVFFW
ncbi:cyclin-J18 isoform X1 [Humulus lupulus]|uniref:cyclin-J18 isoform X1 n=1 Tax=Humulus lupulus TaxID=3486 RepID=UPI002B40ED7D|nr:cyclin-J18 isoform X1 [Humulus lupulus]